MKKLSYTFFALMILLGGCAKVTEQGVPCTGPGPAAPQISNLVIPLGSYANAVVLNYTTGDSVIITGPNNFIVANSTGQLQINVNVSTSYGKYTAVSVINGCTSAPDTFLVEAALTGNPPCTVSSSNYNNLICSNSTTYQVYGASLINYASPFCGYSVYDINGTTTSGFTIDLGLPSYPVAGTYYYLSSNCNYSLSNTQVFATISGAGSIYYQSVSGNVYFNTIAGQPYVTFCDAVFVNVNTNANFTVTGNFEY